MIRLAALSLSILMLAGLVLAQQPKPEPKPEAQPEPEPLIEAKKQETWTLGDQEWDFKDVATAYAPVKGALNAKTGTAEWTLEIVKELAPGEVGIHENTEGSPFKTVLLDADKVVLAEEPEVRFASKLTGKPGERVKIVVQLPNAEVLSQAKFIRIERRTKVGF
ncbi:MAG: hypothetical protein L0211_16730 [Planctomycetaceae bacterium]|nr:hypothetical protein [Planctomycetaceae bacterium]